MNAVTSSCPEAVRIPPYYDSDREAIDAALKTIGPVEPQNAAIVHILDTLRLEEMDVSEAMLPDVEKIRTLSVVGSPRSLKFDTKGNLISKF
jgi:hypothetical protein